MTKWMMAARNILSFYRKVIEQKSKNLSLRTTIHRSNPKKRNPIKDNRIAITKIKDTAKIASKSPVR